MANDYERDRHLKYFDRLFRARSNRNRAPIQFNRWFVPPAALAIHLCIGMAHGFSVF
jgi:hypothetical protein